MIHIIYIIIILFLLYNVIRAYHLYNVKSKELKKYKEVNQIPYDILSHYEKAYVNFYKWMKHHMVAKNIITAYDKYFKTND